MEALQPGQRIGAYRIIRQLGAGGMGKVYEAEHVALGVRRALKVFSTESEHSEFLRKRFVAEGRILADLQHPRIVRVYDLVVDEDTDMAYFEMDLVLSPDGQPRTLADEKRDDDVSEEKIVGWFRDICEGLAYIHSKGVVHRDLSLDNILIGPDGHAVITDFGIAKIIDDSYRRKIDMTITMVVKDGAELRMGKGLYMSPELKTQGGEATFASDAYAVGVILFRLLSGAWYAPGTNLDLLPNFKYDWVPIISQLCNVNPEWRLGEGGIAASPSLLKRVDVDMEEASSLQADHVLQPDIADSADHEANNVPFWRRIWRRWWGNEQKAFLKQMPSNVMAQDTTNSLMLSEPMGALIIPSKIDGRLVMLIRDEAFKDRSELTSVTIPNSVMSIGSSAFEGCGGLTSVTIPKSLMSIGDHAFAYCSGLTSVVIPALIIGEWAFYCCSRLTSVVIAAGVKYIGSGSFSCCSGITSLKISDSVSDIGALAFAGCSSLTSVMIPSGVSNIGAGAFAGCSSLESFAVADDNSHYKSVSGLLLSIDAPSLSVSDGVTLVAVPGGLTSVTIPDRVIRIESQAFRGCIGLMSVTIPNNVTCIGSQVFQDCSGLMSVEIPDSVASIGERAFLGCNKSIYDTDTISNVILVDGWVVAVNYNGSFVGDLDLTGIRGICDSAFINISDLMRVTISDGISSIGERAFFDCKELAHVIIPDSVTHIGEEAFDGTPFYDNQPDGLVVFGRVLYKMKGACPISVTIPDGITSIGAGAFKDCTALTSIMMPDSVTDIGKDAFKGCSGLTSIVIPNSVTSIGDGAFEGCSGLTSLMIPNSVIGIGRSFIAGCSRLDSLTIRGQRYGHQGEEPSVSDGFANMNRKRKLEIEMFTSGYRVAMKRLMKEKDKDEVENNVQKKCDALLHPRSEKETV